MMLENCNSDFVIRKALTAKACQALGTISRNGQPLYCGNRSEGLFTQCDCLTSHNAFVPQDIQSGKSNDYYLAFTSRLNAANPQLPPLPYLPSQNGQAPF